MAAARKGAATPPTTSEAMQADAQLDPNEPVTVLLDGVPCRVQPMRDWRSSGVHALRTGDFERWAETCLVEDDYANVWAAIDPTLDMIETFLETWKEVTGNNTGKSRALRR